MSNSIRFFAPQLHELRSDVRRKLENAVLQPVCPLNPFLLLKTLLPGHRISQSRHAKQLRVKNGQPTRISNVVTGAQKDRRMTNVSHKQSNVRKAVCLKILRDCEPCRLALWEATRICAWNSRHQVRTNTREPRTAGLQCPSCFLGIHGWTGKLTRTV